jgi:hypothetical protein
MVMVTEKTRDGVCLQAEATKWRKSSWHGGYGLIATTARKGIKSCLLTMSVQDFLIA